MSPRKVRLVAGLVRGKKIQPALDQLKFAGKAAAKPVSKLVSAALANAINNFGLTADNLLVKEISVDQGPTLKRWMPRAHGRATPIMKKTSHINVILSEIKDSGIKEGKKVKIEAPVKLSGKPMEDEGIKIVNKDAEVEDSGSEVKNEGKGVNVAKGGGTVSKGFTHKVFRRKSG